MNCDSGAGRAVSETLQIAIAAQALVMYPTIIMLGLIGIRRMSSTADADARISPLPGLMALLVTAPLVVNDVKAESPRSVLVFFSFFWIVLMLPMIGAWWFRGTLHEVVKKGGVVPLRIGAVCGMLAVIAVVVVIFITNLVVGG